MPKLLVVCQVYYLSNDKLLILMKILAKPFGRYPSSLYSNRIPRAGLPYSREVRLTSREDYRIPCTAECTFREPQNAVQSKRLTNEQVKDLSQKPLHSARRKTRIRWAAKCGPGQAVDKSAGKELAAKATAFCAPQNVHLQVAEC